MNQHEPKPEAPSPGPDKPAAPPMPDPIDPPEKGPIVPRPNSPIREPNTPPQGDLAGLCVSRDRAQSTGKAS